MRRGTVYDPRYVKHVAPVASGLASLAYATIFRPAGRPNWQEGVGNTDGHLSQIWAGTCRIQPDIDMRARVRDFQGEYDAVEAVRFDLPFDQNEYGATLDADNKITAYADDPVFALGDVVVVTNVFNPGQETFLGKRFTVRNALPSTTMFQHNLLCDVGTSTHG